LATTKVGRASVAAAQVAEKLSPATRQRISLRASQRPSRKWLNSHRVDAEQFRVSCSGPAGRRNRRRPRRRLEAPPPTPGVRASFYFGEPVGLGDAPASTCMFAIIVRRIDATALVNASICWRIFSGATCEYPAGISN